MNLAGSDAPLRYLAAGSALATEGRLAEAEAALRQALALDPVFAEASCNLGELIGRRGDAVGAEYLFRAAIAQKPGLAAAHNNLGATLFRQGRFVEAIASFRTALQHDPQLAPAYAGIFKALGFLPDVGPALIAEATRRWAALLPRPARHAGWQCTRERDRVLRIGYVSADFRAHSVAHFLQALLAAHDRGAVEILCYSNTGEVDATTTRLCRLADGWRDIARLDDGAAATQIRDDAVDILVDLSGHTDGERLGVFALKPAPVQCTWLGYWATTGLPEIDYVIADRLVIPAGEEALYAETPLLLPDSYLCFTPPDLPPVPGPAPVLRNGFVTFGSCNNLRKLNGPLLALWGRLLGAVPRSRLLLRTAGITGATARQTILDQLSGEGVAAERITLLDAVPRAELLATYRDIDIALDTLPHGGGTTTAEALWMGVPVVTQRGDRFSGRVSASILTAVGLCALVADDAATYLATACELAADAERLAGLHIGLRDRVLASPLCDARRFAHNLESAFRTIWWRWCDGEPAP
jgi:protein O-GlcNAc transferase